MKRKYEIKNNKKPTTKQNINVNVCMSYMLGPLHTVLLIRSLSWKKKTHTGSANVFIDLSPHASCDRVMQNGGLNGDTLIILSGSQTAFFYKCIQFLFRDARNKVKFIFPSYNVTVSNDNLLNKKKNKHARTFTGKRSDLS